MKKIGFILTIAATALLLVSCGGKSFSDNAANIMKAIAIKNHISVKLVQGEIVTKKFGDISISVMPARDEYNTLMESDNFMAWNFTITNNCNRVYKVNDITFSVDLEDHTYNFENMLNRGFYDLHSYMINRDISDINVNPKHQQVLTNKFVWTYDYDNQSKEFGSPIKISLYNIPKCENGKISGHYNAEWNFEVKHR